MDDPTLAARVLSPAEIARMWSVSPLTFGRLAATDPAFPPALFIGGRRRWRLADIVAYMDVVARRRPRPKRDFGCDPVAAGKKSGEARRKARAARIATAQAVTALVDAIKPPQPNRRAIAQSARRERERAAKEAA